MITGCDADTQAAKSESRSAATFAISDYGRQFLDHMRVAMRCPEPGQKPGDLRASPRAWRRNSALLMALYETRTSRN